MGNEERLGKATFAPAHRTDLSADKIYTLPALRSGRSRRELKPCWLYNYKTLSTAICQPSVAKKVRFAPGRQLRSGRRGMKNKVPGSCAVCKLPGLRQQAETGLPFGFPPQQVCRGGECSGWREAWGGLIPPLHTHSAPGSCCQSLLFQAVQLIKY